MKKKIFIIVLVISLIGIVLLGMYLIDRIRMKNNKPVIFSTWGYSYVPPVDLPEEEIKTTIMEFIVNEGDNEYKHHENEKTFASSRIYLIEEKDSLYNIYAWVLEEKYYLENDEIKQDTGSSVPHKFVVAKIEDKFVVADSIIPRDGNYYADDMKSIFPSSVRNDMEDIHTDGTIEELQADIQKQKELYFRVGDLDKFDIHYSKQEELQSPPDLFVYLYNNNSKVKALVGTYSWKITKDGLEEMIMADSLHPSQMKYNNNNILELTNPEISIESKNATISSVNIYNMDKTEKIDKKISFDNKIIMLENLDKGEYALEIIANYLQGNVCYAVKVIVK